jgi:glutamyl/glutaminyl-tRNA synthetase
MAAMFASGRAACSIASFVAAVRPQSTSPVTRFAPAPTGALHLGHVVNAIYVWGIARTLGGRVVLRIEDHDRQRSRRELEAGLLDDLDWLGFTADIYPTDDYRRGPCDGRQSERDAVYRKALQPLIDSGLIYGCDCTRAMLSQTAAPTPAPEGDRRYSGTCRDKGLPLIDGIGWRLKIDDGIEAFEDGLMGHQEQRPSEQCGDLLLRDRLGNWTYQCVATIDDYVQGVTLVIRGQDLLASTGRQLRLARAIGRQHPATFAHHPLIMKSPTQKLSKSDGDSGIRELREAGWSPQDTIGHAAQLAGLTSDRRRVAVEDLPALLSEN